MDLKKEMDQIMRRHRTKTNQLLDQSFMIDHEMIKRIVSASRIKRGDTVVEIGAGIGFVSRELAKTGAKVISIDIDPKLGKILKEELKGTGIKIICGNALKEIDKINFDKIVSNTPYSICESLIQELAHLKFKQAYLSVPKRFAYRLLERKGIGLLAQVSFDIEILFDIPKESFNPEPKINTVFVKIEHRKQIYYKNHPKDFLIRELILQKTKKLRNGFIEALINTWKLKGKRLTKKESNELIKNLNLNNNWLDKRIKDIHLKMIADIIKPLKI